MGWVKLTFSPLLVVPAHSPGFLFLKSPSATEDAFGSHRKPLLLAPCVGFLGCVLSFVERKVYSGNSCGLPCFSLSLQRVPTLQDKGKGESSETLPFSLGRGIWVWMRVWK